MKSIVTIDLEAVDLDFQASVGAAPPSCTTTPNPAVLKLRALAEKLW
jgi:hypothetical protein